MVVALLSLSACTINIYHPSPSGEHGPLSSLLYVPEVATHSTEGARNEPNVVSQPKLIDQPPKASVLKMDVIIDGQQSVSLNIRSEVDAYVNCYYLQGNGDIVKVFPNRFVSRYWVYAGQQLTVPDSNRFQIVADAPDVTEKFMCLASSEDVMRDLPGPFKANVFQRLPLKDFDSLFALYRQSTSANLVGRVVAFNMQYLP